MGFSFGKALMGGVSGFLTGGPAGAVIGAAGGGLSGGGDVTTGTSSSSTSQQVRAMTADEKTRYGAAQRMSMDNMAMLQPGAMDARRDQIGAELQASLEASLGQQHRRQSAAQQTSLLARGMGGGSSSAAMRGSLFGQTQQALGMGTLQAKTQAGQMALGEMANYRANLGASQQMFSGIEQARAGSTSGTSSGTMTQTAPDTSTGDMLGMAMSSLTDPDSKWGSKANDFLSGLFK